MSDHRKTTTTLIISNLILMFGFQVWRTVFNNLAVEDLGLEAIAVGAIQSIREVPGLMGFLLVVMVAVFGSELRSMGFNIIILGLGLVLTGLAQNFVTLVLGTLVSSIGFHYFYSGSQAVLLQVTESADTPHALGRLRSAGALGSILATLGVFGAALVLDNRSIMIAGGVLVCIAGVAMLPRMNVAREYDLERRPARESVRRDYWLYYALTFLMGSRRHVFTTFAIFLLVRVHGLETWQTAILFLINSAVNFLATPQLGRLVAHFGERRMLMFNFISLIAIFIGYATVSSTLVLVGLFVLDNLFFGFSLALNSYFQKIAMVREDITPNMSVGQSINHVAAVIIPVTGGWLWETFDPAVPFLGGAVVAFISLILTHWLREPKREVAWSPTGRVTG